MPASHRPCVGTLSMPTIDGLWRPLRQPSAFSAALDQKVKDVQRHMIDLTVAPIAPYVVCAYIVGHARGLVTLIGAPYASVGGHAIPPP